MAQTTADPIARALQPGGISPAVWRALFATAATAGVTVLAWRNLWLLTADQLGPPMRTGVLLAIGVVLGLGFGLVISATAACRHVVRRFAWRLPQTPELAQPAIAQPAAPGGAVIELIRAEDAPIDPAVLGRLWPPPAAWWAAATWSAAMLGAAVALCWLSSYAWHDAAILLARGVGTESAAFWADALVLIVAGVLLGLPAGVVTACLIHAELHPPTAAGAGTLALAAWAGTSAAACVVLPAVETLASPPVWLFFAAGLASTSALRIWQAPRPADDLPTRLRLSNLPPAAGLPIVQRGAFAIIYVFDHASAGLALVAVAHLLSAAFWPPAWDGAELPALLVRVAWVLGLAAGYAGAALAHGRTASWSADLLSDAVRTVAVRAVLGVVAAGLWALLFFTDATGLAGPRLLHSVLFLLAGLVAGLGQGMAFTRLNVVATLLFGPIGYPRLNAWGVGLACSATGAFAALAVLSFAGVRGASLWLLLPGLSAIGAVAASVLVIKLSRMPGWWASLACVASLVVGVLAWPAWLRTPGRGAGLPGEAFAAAVTTEPIGPTRQAVPSVGREAALDPIRADDLLSFAAGLSRLAESTRMPRVLLVNLPAVPPALRASLPGITWSAYVAGWRMLVPPLVGRAALFDGVTAAQPPNPAVWDVIRVSPAKFDVAIVAALSDSWQADSAHWSRDRWRQLLAATDDNGLVVIDLPLHVLSEPAFNALIAEINASRIARGWAGYIVLPASPGLVWARIVLAAEPDDLAWPNPTIQPLRLLAIEDWVTRFPASLGVQPFAGMPAPRFRADEQRDSMYKGMLEGVSAWRAAPEPLQLPAGP